MYFVTFWCGKCQTGSLVTVQSQFERGTIKIKFLVFCLKGVIPLKNSPQPSMLNKKNEFSYRIHLKFNLSDTHISWKGYLIGSLTPKINIHLMHIRKNRQSEDVYRQKSYFHFRFNTNSCGFFPMQSFLYLKPQGHQLWA